ncbi:hypothetical protein Goari_016955 [Gossypium aridum]|uniref:Uncharacterized protein n=1 Tax=Gossypium aridum TaxID=34290 RepID=A0A7J8WLC3_GOSAI|nr:hypothetical protein [Gossypium aridum]
MWEKLKKRRDSFPQFHF